MYTLQQAKDYFATYYAPNNITGVLVGDFKTAEVKPLLERYFGRLKRGPAAPEVVTLEPKSLGEKRFYAEAETSPTVRVWWQGVSVVHKDFAVLDLLTDVLSGRTGRLTKALVLDKKIANNASAFVNGQKYGGFVGAEVTVKDGQEPSAVEAALYEVIDKLKTEAVPDQELQKVKNQAKANAYRRLSSATFIMFQLLQNDGTGDWKKINTQAEEVDAVSAADIQRAAKQYFTKETRAVGIFTRKAAGSAGGFAGRPGHRRPPRGGAADGQAGAGPTQGREGSGQAERTTGADAGSGGPGAAADETHLRPALEESRGETGRTREGREELVMNLARIVALGLPVVFVASLASAQSVADNPEKLTFAPLTYTPPSGKDYRVVLKNGMVAYLVEDRALPLVNIQATVRAGVWLEPPGKEGLARLTGSQMRAGGTKSLGAEQFDERADFLAAQIGSSMGETSASASLNCLADNLDDSLKLFVEMLRSPGFQEDRLKLAKEQMLQDMKKRNDESEAIEGREFSVLVYGDDHIGNRFSTEASINALTRADLVAFHDMYYYPANMILAVSGAFTKAEMVKKLEEAFANWPSPKRVVAPVADGHQDRGSRLLSHRQGCQSGPGLGGPARRSAHLARRLRARSDERDPRRQRFHSRASCARSDRTKAWPIPRAAASSFGTYFPGRFRASFQSKSSTVAYALQLVFGEIRKMRETRVTDEELLTIKNNIIQTFPSNFESKAQQAGTFAADEYTKRDPLYWSTYRDRIQAVTAADVQRVARQYLVPEKMITLVVGNQAEIAKGDGKHDVTIEKLAGGKVTELPLRDPMTMKRK